MANSEKPPAAYVNLSSLVERIKTDDPSGMEDLYRVFSRGVRFYLCRQLGPQDLDDRMHDTFLVVVQAIRRGDLREPERLMGFVRTVVRRQVAASIDKAVHDRREKQDIDSGPPISDARRNPEEEAMLRERAKIMEKVLGELSERDREILTRFYLEDQRPERICAEMHLTETQFRLLKSRAKARFAELGKKMLNRKNWPENYLRAAAT